MPVTRGRLGAMTKTIRQTVIISASPKATYAALIQEKRHTAFTGVKAKIAPKVGGAFMCYDRYISGYTLDLVPAKRIVQAWRSQGWPAGTYSLVTFALAKAAGGKTRLTFTQIGVPASDYKAKNAGWRSHYWQRLKAYLEKR